MLRSILTCTLFAATLIHAQAPIVRSPPGPPPIDPAWEAFLSTSSDFIGDPIRVRTDRPTLHCILDDVTPYGLACHSRFPSPWSPWLPSDGFEPDRTHIYQVSQDDRPSSGLVGGLLGFGLGAGLGAASSKDGPAAANALLGGALLGALAGFVCYHAPFIHHTLYRRQ